MKKLIRRLRTRLRRLLGKNARTVWISHPVFAQHQPGAGHPDSPERTAVIEAELKRQDIWRHLQTAEAEEISDARLAFGSSAHAPKPASPNRTKSTASTTIPS